MGSAMDGFRKAVDSCNLLDIDFSGSKFTWCNRQFGENVIWERLDRCFSLYGRCQDKGVTGRIFTVEQQIDGINDRMEQFWRQRSRAMWLKEGDRNTRWVVSGMGKEFASIFLLAAWFLWSLKNQTIHGGMVLHSPCLWSRASAYFSDF
ncbi:hypothetical protein ACOSQ3_013366 [Xanthoceras sorbifolium]